MNSEDVLKLLGAKSENLQELKDYVSNRFKKNPNIPEKVEEEPFLNIWKDLILDAEKKGLESTLNQKLNFSGSDIVLENPSKVKLEIYDSFAGPIPIIYALNVPDFEELVVKLVHRGKKFIGIEKTGAVFASGKTNRFIILSNKPYSNIPFTKIGVTEDGWKEKSLIIRREHECTHYFTKRFLGNSSVNIHDEIVADFTGISFVSGTYSSRWFLMGMGLDKYPKPQDTGRFSIYTKVLCDENKDVLKKMTIKISNNIEIWDKSQEAKKMSSKEKILFLCEKSLTELFDLFS
ncbi:MAG: hypothetical protein LBT82_03685 [Oscillospiraceae bacterium]|nr:hypothetical protein [Oscillospiraceae bacterium]